MLTSKLLLFGLLVNFLMLTDVESIGVCNGRLGNNLPTEEDTVTLFQHNRISRMRIYEPYQKTLKNLSGTNIELILDVPNRDLERLTDPNEANNWVQENVISYYKEGVKFKYIAVGNEVDPDPNKESSRYVNFVLPTMNNVYNAIRDVQLSDQIKVSTATYTGLLNNSYPPSAGTFKDTKGFIEPIVKFLAEKKLPILVNIYPYFAYTGDPVNVPLQYALLEPGFMRPDQNTGLVYTNLFYAMLDAHYAALARVDGGDLEIVVSESGWPSDGGHEVATVENAGTYYKNLIAHVKGNKRTPAKQEIPIETYLFAMFDENNKTGEKTEQHFGLFSHDAQPKYDGLIFD